MKNYKDGEYEAILSSIKIKVNSIFKQHAEKIAYTPVQLMTVVVKESNEAIRTILKFALGVYSYKVEEPAGPWCETKVVDECVDINLTSNTFDILMFIKETYNLSRVTTDGELIEREVWCEGFQVTGQQGHATLVGKVEATSFKEAVTLLKTSDHETDIVGEIRYYNWGRRLFDNETEARKTFG